MSLSNDLLSVLCPKTCPACGQVLLTESMICEDCLRSLPRTEEDIHTQDNKTSVLFNGAPHFIGGGCWLHYKQGTRVRDLIHVAKFEGIPEIMYDMAKTAAEEWQNSVGWMNSYNLLIPLPLHPRRLRQRGFNQSEYIARAISHVTGIPVDTSHLRRVRNNPHQSLRDYEERKNEMTQLFAVDEPKELYGRHILLIDDVITSGATMSAALEALRPVRGARVGVYALAKA